MLSTYVNAKNPVSIMQNDFLLALYGGIALLIMFSVFIITFFFINKRKKEQLVLEKQLLTKTYTENLLKTKLEIQEQTIKTISEEIHDNIGQVLSLAKLNLSTIPPQNEEAMNVKLENTKNLVAKAINDLRNLSRSLYGDRISEMGLIEATQNELKIIEQTGQVITHLKLTGEPYKLSPQKELVLFRIMQEALNNAIKYSKSKNLEVELNFAFPNFKLCVQDFGIGFNISALQNAAKGVGTKSMMSRAELIGGKLDIISQPGNGTTICAIVPKD